MIGWLALDYETKLCLDVHLMTLAIFAALWFVCVNGMA